MVSASSWGCELKCNSWRTSQKIARQPLREAVSWNFTPWQSLIVWRSQPLREAVSWNISAVVDRSVLNRQPLREAVSWNEITECYESKYGTCQPLREAVSWNSFFRHFCDNCSVVSLFVRLWVEIVLSMENVFYCNRQPLREAVSWNKYWSWNVLLRTVSLFVRLWVEIFHNRLVLSMENVSLFVRLWVEISMGYVPIK